MGGKKRGLGHFLIKNRNRILTAATAAAVFLGVVGSFQYYSSAVYAGKVVENRLLSSILYSVLKLFTFSPTVNAGTPTPICYELAKWLAPLCTGYWLFTAFEVLLRHRILTLTRSLSGQGQAAIFGYNKESAAYLAQLSETDRIPAVIFTGRAMEQEQQLALERQHFLVEQEPLSDGEGTKERLFFKRLFKFCREAVLFHEEASVNFRIAKKLSGFLAENPRTGTGEPFVCAVRCESRIMEQVMTNFFEQNPAPPGLSFSFFHMPGMAARDLFERVPVYENCLEWAKKRLETAEKMLRNAGEANALSPQEIMEQIPNPHVLIAGFGRYGQEILRELLLSGTLSWCSQVKGYEILRITIVDRDCRKARERIESLYPAAEKICRIEYIEAEIGSVQVERTLRSLPPVTYAIICFSSQTAGIEAVEKLGRFFGMREPDMERKTQIFEIGPVPTAVRMEEGGDRVGLEAKEYGGVQVYRFGNLREILKRERVLHQKLDQEAKEFNGAYAGMQRRLAKAAGAELSEEEKQSLWDALSYEKRESNRAQVRSRRYLKELMKLLPSLPAEDEILKDKMDREQILDMLSRYPVLDVLAAQEHKRWCCFHYAMGYVGYHPDPEEKGNYHWIFGKQELYGRVHNCLIDSWEEMKADPKASLTIPYDICGIYACLREPEEKEA